MNDKVVAGVHWSFWIITAVALIWNLLGCLNYFMQMSADAVATMPESHRAIIASRPLWATGGFAVAVIAGALGCFLLLLRKSVAYYLFILSLLGVIVAMIHTVDIASSAKNVGPFEIIMMILMPIVIAVFLIWYTKLAINKGWIK